MSFQVQPSIMNSCYSEGIRNVPGIENHNKWQNEQEKTP
ncbi:hypothetical protein CWATWH0402_4908 [Crocosphaera watsonii WH 0402]|uniref:Uncharacterized protein n=2 Tax=Crocosphaera watsonii TaxID=263511 RepID=T2JQE4_CROWT|nr:hypothetical protein CWATWH0401_3706 [Crocosphaera watsonii WH 0401]CCQ68088.1 hypothetical protein CWATWH0402_4908 [Crocosphaera watsonii WH 0402]